MPLLKVKTCNGVIVGLPSENQTVSVFKGIPFAKPPLGDLRWRVPQKPDSWIQDFHAYTYGPIPCQDRVAKGSVRKKEFYPQDLEQSEDCLYLNVWTPAESPSAKLPVAVWIYGGGFCQGYANKQETGGDAFGRRGCVYVSFNYRLGVFGFLAHEDLTCESPQHASGNYGLMDQIMALTWVQENIEAFGGDPNNVTVFGQSAGAMSIMYLMTSPLSCRLFQKVILQSGGGLHPAGIVQSLEGRELQGKNFLVHCGVENIAHARELSAEKILHESDSFVQFSKTKFGPCVDGYLLPQDPCQAIREGKFPDIPCIIGHNRDESSFSSVQHLGSMVSPSDMKAWIHKYCGQYAERIIRMENLKTNKDVEEYMCSSMRRLIIPGTYAFAEICASRKSHVYLYVFEHVPPGEPNVGVYHSAEKMYVFETVIRSWRPMSPEDYGLSLEIAELWTNFVKYGDPNGKGEQIWQAYSSAFPVYLSLNIPTRMKALVLDKKTETYKHILEKETAVL